MFAVGTGCHKIFVGFHEETNNWWNSLKISGFKSSVVCVNFHPSGRVIGAGSTDHSFRIYTCVVKDDKK